MAVLAIAQPVADHLFVAPDGGLDPAALVVAGRPLRDACGTTRLYDRCREELSLDGVEQIGV
jgi:hypothetical protein